MVPSCRRDPQRCGQTERQLCRSALCGFEAMGCAWVEMGVDYALTNDTDAQDNRWHLQRLQKQPDVDRRAEPVLCLLGSMKAEMLQYADKGLAHNMIDQGGGWYDVWNGDNSEAKGYRFINNGDIPLGDKFYVNYVLTYGKAEKYADWTDNTELSPWWAAPSISGPISAKSIVKPVLDKEDRTYLRPTRRMPVRSTPLLRPGPPARASGLVRTACLYLLPEGCWRR